MAEITSKQTALIVHPDLSLKLSPNNRRDAESMRQEICGLARAIELEVVGVETFKISKIQAGHFLGEGQREKIAEQVEALKPDIVIVNHTLSPVQQRNLESSFGAKVIDRTGLILEIFGARAQTKEGRLQVELAALDYQRSRLVRSWTHLERQRGGAGFMGGPGERQIEIDRRLLSVRMTKLKKNLEQVRKTRDLGRKARAKIPFPVVALVGYTNAGKSTLFNLLTKEKVFAEDLLFATLDPVLRKITLPSGQKIILSDTVGFISDLPTHLIAAFRATLEETLHADVILHVCDAAGDDFQAQKADVIEILQGLGIEYESDDRIIEVYNKTDLLTNDTLQDDLKRKAQHDERVFLVSALTGQGSEALLDEVNAKITASSFCVTFLLPCADGQALSWLYDHGEVSSCENKGSETEIEVRISSIDLARFTDRHGYQPV